MEPFTMDEYKRQPKEGVKKLRDCFQNIFLDFQDISGEFPAKKSIKPSISDFNTENNCSDRRKTLIRGEQNASEISSSSPFRPSGLFPSKFTKRTWASYDKRCKTLDGRRRTRGFEKGIVSSWCG
jgi:hypothetical protein